VLDAEPATVGLVWCAATGVVPGRAFTSGLENTVLWSLLLVST
jgi:hypothetical protein